MDIIKIAFFSLTALFFIILVQQSRKDLAIIISLFVGVSIFVFARCCFEGKYKYGVLKYCFENTCHKLHSFFL